jgi:hypothetical protein
MRRLTKEEIEFALDDNGESEEGCIAVESSILELSNEKVGTCCGMEGNSAFTALCVIFLKDDLTRLVRGWYDKKDKVMCGMVHIQCENEKMAEKISEAAHDIGDGSLRVNDRSRWEGFYEFEIE